MTEISTSRRFRAASNAGAGYDPPARKPSPEMLKQSGGNRQTGFVSEANCTGVPHDVPRFVDFDAYSTVPLPPCRPLSKTRYALPDGSVTIRWSWLLRTFAAVTLFWVQWTPWSRDAAT